MNKALKILLGIGLCLIIYLQLSQHDTVLKPVSQHDFLPVFALISVLCMPLNWFLEALKWKLLLRPIITLTNKEAIKNILTGVFLGFFTPARVGEYGGRMIHLPDDVRVRSLAATFYGSVIQNIVHVAAGFSISYLFIQNLMPDNPSYLFVFVVFISAICICFFLILFMPALRNTLLEKIKNIKPFMFLEKFSYLGLITRRTVFFIFVLSCTRYLVYFFQYLFILKSLGATLPIISLSPGVSFIYLVQSGIPLPPVLNILGRGEVSVLVWQQFGISAQIALLATFILWTINLVIPAIAGYIIVLRYKFKL